jgi:hypothetical protein
MIQLDSNPAGYLSDAISALIGLLVSLTPLSCALLGWKDANQSALMYVSTIFSSFSHCSVRRLISTCSGVFIFWGGLMMTVAGLLEFFLGNTFPCVVFMSLGMLSQDPPRPMNADQCFPGALFFSIGATNIPAFGVMQSFVTADYASGAQNPQFYSSFG